MAEPYQQHPSSYRDPSGFIFYKNNILYRQVNQVFKKDFDQLIEVGLYQHLVDNKLLIPHKRIEENLTGSPDWHTTLQPELLPFITYPYEWCFEMLKDASLLTLHLAKEAMNYGMMLRDASAYNVQLHNGKMVFIDSLSFELYNEKKPWVAYRQFCEHFFAPLGLMHYLKQPLQTLFLAYPDGVPLNTAAAMLPFKSKFNLHSYLHVHLQHTISKKSKIQDDKNKPFSRQKMKNLLQSLEDGIRFFSFSQSATPWSGYYEEAKQRGDYVRLKKEIVDNWLDKLNFDTVFDAGANDGEFSELVSSKSRFVISSDLDHSAISKLYNKVQQKHISNIYPLLIDLSRPSPAIGVNNKERMSFLERCKVDLVLALALIHHLVIGNNIPFGKVAEMFGNVTRYLIIEFVPETDEKISLMTVHKKNVLTGYSEENFLNGFTNYFSLVDKNQIGDSGRTLFLMEKRNM